VENEAVLSGKIESGWQRIMALSAYVDDSGSEPNAQIYVLGGVVLPTGWWEELQGDWAGVLAHSPSVPYFKASEVWDHNKGPFRDFTNEQRQQKVRALAEVICDLHPLALSVSVRWKDFLAFKDTVVLPVWGQDPYFFLFYRLLVLAIQFGQHESHPTPIDFTFDEQNGAWKQVKRWYEQFQLRLSLELLAFLGKEPEKADEKTCLPLQAADLFAWYTRRDALGTLDQPWHQSLRGWLFRYHTSVELDQDSLLAMANDLGITESKGAIIAP
jgi:hypothetical protein